MPSGVPYLVFCASGRRASTSSSCSLVSFHSSTSATSFSSGTSTATFSAFFEHPKATNRESAVARTRVCLILKNLRASNQIVASAPFELGNDFSHILRAITPAYQDGISGVDHDDVVDSYQTHQPVTGHHRVAR